MIPRSTFSHRALLPWLLTGGLLLLASLGMLDAGSGKTPSWEIPYQGEEANGPEVIAFWSFDPQAPEADGSGRGHHLTLRDTKTGFTSDGRFSGALRIAPRDPSGENVRQGASTPSLPDLTPKGAFTLELWLQPDAALASGKLCYLIDKKYLQGKSEDPAAHRDYSLLLRKSAGGADRFVVEADLGFGDRSEVVRSSPCDFKPGVWHHLAFTYDGSGGAKFYVDGVLAGEEQIAHAHALAAGERPLVIGDRVGSTGWPFAGAISQVRLSDRAIVFTPRNAVIQDAAHSRTAFYRMENKVRLKIDFLNAAPEALEGAAAHLQGEDGTVQKVALPPLKAQERTTLEIPIDTSLRPGPYARRLQTFDADGEPVSEPITTEITLVPRPLPHRMPVVMWGGIHEPERKRAQEIGFTHYLGIWQGSTSHEVRFLSPAKVQESRQALDRALAMQLGVLAQISPGRPPGLKTRYSRVDRSGESHPTLNGLFPQAQEAARAAGAFVAEAFGDLPALQGALIDTEVRDHTRPSFHPIDQEAYRKAGGGEIPPEVDGFARGISYRKLPGFPARRILPEDDPLLHYYRWFWKEGDGWNRLHTLVDEGLKSTGRDELWTWFDPAVRAPSLFGSGGGVDYLSQWTYTYPDPLKISLATDELAAMAAGHPGQQIMTMTQIIWYRSQTAPIRKDDRADTIPQAEWETREAEAKFITIAPDHLSEALWLKLSHPVQGIMYHGWGSLVSTETGGYRYTHPQTVDRLKSLLHEIVEPLGPTLRQVPDAKTDVAFLESFTSQIFAGRGTWGWGSGWGADSYLLARYAGLQPAIVYEETILNQGLDGYQVLLVTHCDVLTQKVAKAIESFQQRGGIVIGDEGLPSTLQPDILLSSFRRSGNGAQDKAALLKKAAQLRAELNPHYRRPVESDNPEVVLRQRSTGGGDYLFAINDHRQYGDYVGQYRLVMEEGVASQAVVTLQRPTGFVYDLVERKEVPTETAEGALRFPVRLGPGDGRLFLILDEPIGSLEIKAAPQTRQGESFPVALQLKSRKGGPVEAVLPIHVTVRDAKGRSAEGSGHYGAAGGELQLLLDIAPNDAPGRWEVEATEGLTGSKTTIFFEVQARQNTPKQ